MSTSIDMGGNTLYVSDLVYGDNTPGALSGTSLTSTLTAVDATNLAYQRFTITGVNMNTATTDHAITITLPAGVTTYAVADIALWGASHTLTTATLSCYTATSASGVEVAADQAITNTSGTANTNLNLQHLSLYTDNATTALTSGTLYARVGTAEGAAATANVTVTIQLLG